MRYLHHCVVENFLLKMPVTNLLPNINKKYVIWTRFTGRWGLTLTDVTVISAGTGYTTPAVILVGGGGTGAKQQRTYHAALSTLL